LGSQGDKGVGVWVLGSETLKEQTIWETGIRGRIILKDYSIKRTGWRGVHSCGSR